MDPRWEDTAPLFEDTKPVNPVSAIPKFEETKPVDDTPKFEDTYPITTLPLQGSSMGYQGPTLQESPAQKSERIATEKQYRGIQERIEPSLMPAALTGAAAIMGGPAAGVATAAGLLIPALMQKHGLDEKVGFTPTDMEAFSMTAPSLFGHIIPVIGEIPYAGAKAKSVTFSGTPEQIADAVNKEVAAGKLTNDQAAKILPKLQDTLPVTFIQETPKAPWKLLGYSSRILASTPKGKKPFTVQKTQPVPPEPVAPTLPAGTKPAPEPAIVPEAGKPVTPAMPEENARPLSELADVENQLQGLLKTVQKAQGKPAVEPAVAIPQPQPIKPVETPAPRETPKPPEKPAQRDLGALRKRMDELMAAYPEEQDAEKALEMASEARRLRKEYDAASPEERVKDLLSKPVPDNMAEIDEQVKEIESIDFTGKERPKELDDRLNELYRESDRYAEEQFIEQAKNKSETSHVRTALSQVGGIDVSKLKAYGYLPEQIDSIPGWARGKMAPDEVAQDMYNNHALESPSVDELMQKLMRKYRERSVEYENPDTKKQLLDLEKRSYPFEADFGGEKITVLQPSHAFDAKEKAGNIHEYVKVKMSDGTIATVGADQITVNEKKLVDSIKVKRPKDYKSPDWAKGEIPEFKSTEDAIRYGQGIKGKPEVIAKLRELSKSVGERSLKTDNADEAMRLSTKSQLYREAAESAEGKIDKKFVDMAMESGPKYREGKHPLAGFSEKVDRYIYKKYKHLMAIPEDAVLPHLSEKARQIIDLVYGNADRYGEAVKPRNLSIERIRRQVERLSPREKRNLPKALRMVMSDNVGDLIETFKYETEKDGQEYEAWIDDILKIADDIEGKKPETGKPEESQRQLFRGREKAVFDKSALDADQEKEILRLNEKIFGDRKINFVEKIAENEEAAGYYQAEMIKILKGEADAKDTFFHEAAHKYMDIFLTKEELNEVLELGGKKYDTPNKRNVHERIAEDFINYAKNRQGVLGRMRLLFDRLITRIKQFLGNKDAINKLYQDILTGNARKAGEAVGAARELGVAYRDRAADEKKMLQDAIRKTQKKNEIPDEQMAKIYKSFGEPGGPKEASLAGLRNIYDHVSEFKGPDKALPAKAAINKVTGVRPAVKPVESSEDVMLRKQIRDEARGADWGYKEGEKVTKEILVKKYKEGKQRLEEVVGYIKQSLPEKEQGKFISALKNVQDSVKKQMSIINRVDIHAGKIEEATLTARIKRLRKYHGNIAVDYKKKLEDIIGDINWQKPNPETTRRLRSLQQYIQENGEPLGIQPERIEELRKLTRKNLRDLSTDELKALKANLEMLQSLGRVKAQLKNKYNIRERQKSITTLVESSHNLDPQRKGAGKDSIARNKRRFERKQVYLRTMHTPRVADKIDGNAGYKGENAKYIKALGSSENRAKTEANNIMADLKVEMSKIKKEWSEKEQRDIVLLLYKEQPDSWDQVNALVQAYGYEKFPEKTPEYAKAMNLIRKALDHSNRVAPIYEEIENEIFRKVENYFPRMYEKETTMAPKDMISQERHRTTETFHGFTECRLEGVKKIPRTDLFNMVEESVNGQMWYIHMQPELENIKYLVTSPEYQEKAGELATNFWKDEMDIVARRGWMASAKPQENLKHLRKNLSVAMLGFRASSVAIQPVAVFDAMAYMQANHGARAAGEMLKEVTKTWVSPKYARAVIGESKGLTLREGGELGMEETLSDAKQTKRYLGKLAALGMKPLQKADLLTAAGVQKGVQNILEKYGVENAKEEADFVMNLVQGSADVTYRPHILATGEIARAAFTFQTFVMNRWGIIEHDLFQSKLRSADLTEKLQGGVGMAIIMAAFLAEDLARRGVNGLLGKETKKSAADSAILAIPSQIPYFGGMIESAYYGFDYNIPLLGAAGDIVTGVVQVARGKNVGKNIIKAGAYSAGLAFGVPGTFQLTDMILNAMKQGENGGGTDKPMEPMEPAKPEGMKLPKRI